MIQTTLKTMIEKQTENSQVLFLEPVNEMKISLDGCPILT